MDASTLELTVLSCRDLKAFNFFQKLSPYVAVSIVPGPNCKSRGSDRWPLQLQTTPVDRVRNRNPEWNHQLSFDLEPYINSSTSADRRLSGDTYLRFEVRCTGTILSSQTIGEVWVRLTDLIEEFRGAPRFLSYQVKKTEKRANGSLNFSFKVNGKLMKTTSTANNHMPEATNPSPEAIPRKPEVISNPSANIEDTGSPSRIPPTPPHQTPAPYDNVFYVQNNGSNSCTCRPLDAVPVPEHGYRSTCGSQQVQGSGS